MEQLSDRFINTSALTGAVTATPPEDTIRQLAAKLDARLISDFYREFFSAKLNTSVSVRLMAGEKSKVWPTAKRPVVCVFFVTDRKSVV